MITKFRFILLFIFCLSINQYSQQAVADSLEDQLNSLSGEEKVDTYGQLSDIYQYINTKKAFEFASKGVELAKQINYPKGMASCYGSIGYSYINLDNDKAIEFTQKALKVRQRIEDKAGIATSLNVLGVIYYYQGDYLTSIENHFKAMKMREEVGDENKMATSYNNISLVYLALEDYDTALEYLNKALVIRTKTHNNKGSAIIKGNIGDIYSRMGKYDKAISYLNDALLTNKKTGNKISEAGVYLIFAKIFMEMNNNKAALDNYKMAIDLYSEIDEKHGMSQAENGIASILQNEGKIELAISHAQNAIEQATSINSLENIVKAANTLQTAYSSLGDYKKAFEYATLYQQSSDSLKISDKIKKLAKTEFEYKIQVIKKIQESEIAYQKNFIKWLTVTIILGGIIIVLIIFGYFHIRKTNRQLNNLNNSLKEHDYTKDKFLSIIAHDLRGPFHALLGLSEALANDIDELSNDEIKDYNKDINKSLKRQYELLNNLLHWSRLQNTNFSLSLESICLFDELNNTIQTLELAAAEKKISITNEVDKTIAVNADKSMIQLVMRNIISNSIKFSIKNGTIKIFSEQFDGHIKISVSDKGVGIPAKDLDKIFRMDVQYSTAGTMDEKGTGLGLMLCKEIVEKHGGSIEIKSEPGRGTDVTFSLKVI